MSENIERPAKNHSTLGKNKNRPGVSGSSRDKPDHRSRWVGISEYTDMRKIIGALMKNCRAVVKDAKTLIMNAEAAEKQPFDSTPCTIGKLVEACNLAFNERSKQSHNFGSDFISLAKMENLLDGRIPHKLKDEYNTILELVLDV